MRQFPSTTFHGTSVDPIEIYADDFGQGDQMSKAFERAVFSGREESGLPEDERNRNVAYRIRQYSEGQESLASHVGSLAAAVKDLATALSANHTNLPATNTALADVVERLASIESKITGAAAALGNGG